MNLIVEVNQANFKQEVLDSMRPVLVDFWADWCGPCKMIAPMLEEVAAEFAGRVKIAEINVDENPALAELHHIQSIPTLLLFQNGLVNEQLVDVASKRAVVSKLESLWPKRAGNAVPCAGGR